jgi:protein-S-isoprenylcysteine O-methyltransferase Ste14
MVFMVFIGLGCAAFGFLYLFDLSKVFHWPRFLHISFGIGCALLAYATCRLIFLPGGFDAPLGAVRIFFLTLSVFSFLLMIYALFFALPFRRTYIGAEDVSKVVDTGMYALCRHPGVLWFFFSYLFLWLASKKALLFLACLLWTAMDVLHVFVQDRCFFQKTLIGYFDYQKTTPFLVPNASSIKRCLSTLKVR